MSQHLERCNGTQVLDLDTHQQLRRFKMRYVLPRQYKGVEPAQQALRQPLAPYHAGLFAWGT